MSGDDGNKRERRFSAVRGRNEKRKREKKEKSLGGGVREQKWHQVERKRKQKKIEKRAEGEKGGACGCVRKTSADEGKRRAEVYAEKMRSLMKRKRKGAKVVDEERRPGAARGEKEKET